MRHGLKIWPVYFDDVSSGRKKFEYRENDRGFFIHDELVLNEYNPQTEAYTGRSVTVKVTYTLYGGIMGIPENYVIMGIKRVGKG